MSSPEQYAFEQNDQTFGTGNPNLLPSEFQWQPTNGTGTGGTVIDQTGGAGYVDQTAQYTGPYVDQTTGQYVAGSGNGQYDQTTQYSGAMDQSAGNGRYYVDQATGQIYDATTGQVVAQTGATGMSGYESTSGSGQFGTGYDTTGQYTNTYPTDTTGGGIVTNNSGIVDGSGNYVPGSGSDTLPQQPGYSEGVVVPPQTQQTGTDQGSYQIDPNTGKAVFVDQAGNVYQVDQNTGQIIQGQNGGQTIPMDQTGGQTGGQTVPIDQTGGQAPLTPQTGVTDSSSDVTGKKGGGGLDPMWWLDRGGSLLSTGVAAHMYAPNLQAFMPEGGKIPTLESMRSIPKGEWKNAVRTDIGKAMGGAWVGDTILDATLLKDRETGPLTLAVDIATPFIANKLVPGLGIGKTIGVSMLAHAAEKMIFEDKKE